MDRLIYHNDRVLDSGQARLAPTVAGATLGWGVFTMLRVYEGVPLAFERHWARLADHAERARVPLPFTAAGVRAALDEVLAANDCRNGRARVTLLRGAAGAWQVDGGREAELLIFTAGEAPRPAAPLALTHSPIRLLSSGPLAGVKRTAMHEHLLAFEEARSRDFDEAVMLNERGEIVSATAGNIFWVENEAIHTPSPATGCVAGVTRAIVIDLVRRMRLHLVEGSFPLARLLEAREVFLTSTTREIAPVGSFDVKEYDPAQARYTGQIVQEFKKIIRGAKLSR